MTTSIEGLLQVSQQALDNARQANEILDRLEERMKEIRRQNVSQMFPNVGNKVQKQDNGNDDSLLPSHWFQSTEPKQYSGPVVQATVKSYIKPTGIENHGNTCYAIAVIHLLRSIAQLFPDKALQGNEPVIQFINEINPRLKRNQIQNSESIVQRKTMEDTVKACGLDFGYQEDAVIFLRLLLQNEYIENHLEMKYIETKICISYFMYNDTGCIDLYTDNKCTKLKEQCDKITVLPLALNDAINVATTLGTMLKTYQEVIIKKDDNNMMNFRESYEKLNDNECSKLSHSGHHCEKVRIASTSTYIIMNVGIFNERNQKANVNIQLEHVHILNQVYEPISVVIHLGESINGGHYVNVSKIGESWYLFNDDSVKEIGNAKSAQDAFVYVRNKFNDENPQPYLVLLRKPQKAIILNRPPSRLVASPEVKENIQILLNIFDRENIKYKGDQSVYQIISDNPKTEAMNLFVNRILAPISYKGKLQDFTMTDLLNLISTD
jgi:hypothetical protein